MACNGIYYAFNIFVLLFCVQKLPYSLSKSILMMDKIKAEAKEKLMLQHDSDKVIEETVNKVDPADDVAPPKHLDAVKIDRNGNLNSDFHKEIFLGEEIDEFKSGKLERKEQRHKLMNVFELIDNDLDNKLDENELANWILAKTNEHFEEAKVENVAKFRKLDTAGVGSISWKKYLVEFLVQRGFDRSNTTQLLGEGKLRATLDQETSDDVEDLKDRWMQASREGSLNALNQSEFMDFQHPEASYGQLQYLVEDFLHDMDANDDGNLTLHEFISIGSDVDVDSQTDQWAIERKKEFRDVIDANHDDVITNDELQKYLDPLSISMARQEARQMIAFGDDDQDGALSLDELLENSEFFTGSKLYNYARSVHYDL